jgi:D-glycero-alpha-D-manno-heptose-7-phosphate kinase
MIIARTPLRMSFVGGGSDLPAYYQKYGGAVVSTAIDKYVYVNVNKKFDDGIRVGYSKNEEVNLVTDIEHPIVRKAFEYLGLKGGIEITTIADIPSGGTGLGSSSSFTVSLLHALYAYMGKYASAEQLAREASLIEIELCKEPIGKQDQYAAAYGGFNLIKFQPDGTVIVEPIITEKSTLKKIENRLLIFYTGKIRSASSLLQKQSFALRKDVNKIKIMHQMVEQTHQMATELRSNNADAIGDILHEGWLLKKGLLNEITDPDIDRWYEKATNAGAVGGKILGAGAGGFLLIYAPEEKHDGVRKSLNMLKEVKMKFDSLGSRIIFFHQTQ